MQLLQRLRDEVRGVFDLLLPPACPLCGEESYPLLPLCRRCAAGIVPLTTPRCPRCALPFATEGGTDHLCEECSRTPPPFSGVTAVGIFGGTLREAIHRCKFDGHFGLDRPLAKMLATAVQKEFPHFRPDLLLPVPLHLSRLRERTFNQALLLANRLGKEWQVPVPPRLLIRARPTATQQGLSAEARRRNVRDAFALHGEVEGKRVLLVDDVMTTGATARECAHALIAAGAEEVRVAVLARAARGHPPAAIA